MNLLIKAEIFKIKRTNLLYFGILLAIFPFVLSALFIYGSDSFAIFGKYDVLSYTNGMLSTVVLGTGIYFIFFSLIINSVISTEIGSNIILYEAVGSNKRSKLFIAKISAIIIFSTVFLIIVLLSSVVSYYIFLTQTNHITNTHEYYELGNFLYGILYYYGIVVVISSLSFFNMKNSLVIISLVYNLVTMRLSTIASLSAYIIGSPVYTNVSQYGSAYYQYLLTQTLLLITITGIITYLSYVSFGKRDL